MATTCCNAVPRWPVPRQRRGTPSRRSSRKETRRISAPPTGTQAEIILRWPQEQSIRRVVLRENLLESQRIEQYALDMETPQGWREIVRGRVVGNKRIIDTHGIRTAALRLRILDARVSITLSFLGVYS